MKEHLVFFGSVCVAILVINQIGPLAALLQKNYFAAATA